MCVNVVPFISQISWSYFVEPRTLTANNIVLNLTFNRLSWFWYEWRKEEKKEACSYMEGTLKWSILSRKSSIPSQFSTCVPNPTTQNPSKLRTLLLYTRKEDYSKSVNFLGREGGRGPDARVAIFQGKIGALWNLPPSSPDSPRPTSPSLARSHVFAW